MGYSNTDIKLENFFNIGSTEPINRIAYSKEDAEYKLLCIKAMLDSDPSIQITIDKIGNICATLPARYHLVNSKSIIAGSHTDSVRNGGQYDGALGVFLAMNTLKELVSRKNSTENKLEMYTDYKAIIFACEESTRFNMACIGSSYIANPDYVKNEDGKEYYYFDSLCQKADALLETDEEPNQGTLGNALIQYKSYLENGFKKLDLDTSRIKFVDKVITPEEIDQLFEGHIEQSQELLKKQIRKCAEYSQNPDITNFKQAPKPGTITFSKLPALLGRVIGIGKPVRGNLLVHSAPGTSAIVTAAHLIMKNREMALNSPNDSIRTSIPEFNSFDENKEYTTLQSNDHQTYYKITCKGSSDHSGGTPMLERSDSNVGISALILQLDKMQKENPTKFHFDFKAVKTPIFGMNQIQDNTILYLESSIPLESMDSISDPILKKYIKFIQERFGVSFELEKATTPFKVPTNNHIVELKNDIRQNGIATAKKTLQTFQKDVIEKTYSDIGLDINNYPDVIKFTKTSQGDPVLTSQELLEDFMNVCKKLNIICVDTQSFPGHDGAVALPPRYKKDSKTGKRLLIFIPSLFGSHNPNEQTWLEAIISGMEAFNGILVSRFKFLERQAYNYQVSPRLSTPPDTVYEFGSNELISTSEQQNRFQSGDYSNIIPELNQAEKEEILDNLFDPQIS